MPCKKMCKNTYRCTNSQHVTSVKTYHSVDVFVSRLHPNTAKAELVDCVNFCKGDLPIDIVTCTQLKARYEHLYSLFWVDLRVEARYMKQTIDLFVSADALVYFVEQRTILRIFADF